MQPYTTLFYLGAWVTTMGIIWVLFDRAEKIASNELKDWIKGWLQKDFRPPGVVSVWPNTFVGVFDLIFGNRHLSWKCFFRLFFFITSLAIH
jgi:hypothetical protein